MRLRLSSSRRKRAALMAVVTMLLYTLVDMDYLKRLLLPPAKFSDWYIPRLEQHQARGLREPIHPHPFKPVLRPPPCPEGLQLAVYVHSAAANFQRRDLIRATWGNRDVLEKARGALVFVLGLPEDSATLAAVQRESERHHDVLLEDFRDSYFNLTLKAVAALSWLAASCSGARFVLKTDDDVLVSVDGLQEELRQRYGHVPEPRGVLLCSVITNPPVNRQWWSKWYTSKAFYAPHTYSSFCEGAAFVLSPDVVAAMAAAAKDMPFFPLDDVFVTGMLAEKLGVRHVNMEERFHTGNWGHVRASPKGLYFVVEEDPLKFLDKWHAMELLQAQRAGDKKVRPGP